MSINDSTTMTMLTEVFAETIATVGGEVRDAFDDGRRLFLRSVLPEMKEVSPGDAVQGGVALRSDGIDVWVHPYIFRQVCSNGAIMAQSTQTRHIADLGLRPADEVLIEVRQAVEQCAAPAALRIGADQMRGAREIEADMGLAIFSIFADQPREFVTEFMQSWFDEWDHSAFGLANAITAKARETEDPELRWELEELGGGVFANFYPRTRHPDALAARRVESMDASADESRRRKNRPLSRPT